MIMVWVVLVDISHTLPTSQSNCDGGKNKCFIVCCQEHLTNPKFGYTSVWALEEQEIKSVRKPPCSALHTTGDPNDHSM